MVPREEPRRRNSWEDHKLYWCWVQSLLLRASAHARPSVPEAPLKDRSFLVCSFAQCSCFADYCVLAKWSIKAVQKAKPMQGITTKDIHCPHPKASHSLRYPLLVSLRPARALEHTEEDICTLQNIVSPICPPRPQTAAPYAHCPLFYNLLFPLIVRSPSISIDRQLYNFLSSLFNHWMSSFLWLYSHLIVSYWET